MKQTGIKAAIVVLLAVTFLAGEALAGPGGGWGRGRGGGQAWGRGISGGPRMGANFKSVQPNDFWGPGPYCPFGQSPNQNLRGWQGRRPGGFGQSFQGRGMGRFGQGFQGRGMGGFGQGFQGRGMAMQGRSNRIFQRRNITPQGRSMNNRQRRPGPGGIGRPSQDMRPRRFTPEDPDQTNQPTPPRNRDWAPGWGQGWRRNPQPEKPQSE